MSGSKAIGAKAMFLVLTVLCDLNKSLNVSLCFLALSCWLWKAPAEQAKFYVDLKEVMFAEHLVLLVSISHALLSLLSFLFFLPSFLPSILPSFLPLLLSFSLSAVTLLCERCFYDIKICSSLSGSWAVSRAWRPYWMKVEAVESERHSETGGECLCMKASDEDWWKLTNIKDPREKEGVWRKKKKEKPSRSK